jgi:hypothetical protein
MVAMRCTVKARMKVLIETYLNRRFQIDPLGVIPQTLNSPERAVGLFRKVYPACSGFNDAIK